MPRWGARRRDAAERRAARIGTVPDAVVARTLHLLRLLL
jgi:hypothetical protein